MKRLIVLFCSIFAVCTAQNKNFVTLTKGNVENRMVNGTSAEVGQFPWQVSIHYLIGFEDFFCGGALISNMWVLTAAHCVDGGFMFFMRFGALDNLDGVFRTAAFSIKHEKYNKQLLSYDIALLRLIAPVEFNDRIKPIRLPKPGMIVKPEDVVRVSGWGRTNDNDPISKYLKWEDLVAIKNEDCKKIFDKMVSENTLCCQTEKYQGTCYGDSGSPITMEDKKIGERYHVGIVSFVHNSGCGQGIPSGYIRTESMLKWIEQHTGISYKYEYFKNSI